MRDDKTCVMCGKPYKYCENCPSKYNTTETWRNIFCSENCREIYFVYDKMKSGQISDSEAGKKLKKLDMSYLKNIKEPMKAMLTFALNDVENKNSKTVKEEIDKVVSEERPKKTRSKTKTKRNSEVS